MSELLVNTIKKADGTGSLSVPAESGTVVTTASPSLGRRNLIINGDLSVWQRSTSLTGQTSGGYIAPDRYNIDFANIGTWSITKDSDAPSGFGSSLKIACTTADASPAANDAFVIHYGFEGQDLQRIKKGTSDAQELTLSFWVKAYQTGTLNITLRDFDNNRIVGGQYTINSSATWEYKTITFPADTTGAFDNDNAKSMQMDIWLATGSTYTTGTLPTAWETRNTADQNAGSTINLADSTSNYWQITGVQLEVGSVATPFEHRSYGEELALCQRYYQTSYNTGVSPGSSVDEFAGNNGGQGVYHAFGTNVSGGVASSIGSFVTQMRTRPTVTVYDHSGNSGKITTFDSGSSSTANQSYNSVRQSQRQIIVRTYQSSIFGFEYLYEADAEL